MCGGLLAVLANHGGAWARSQLLSHLKPNNKQNETVRLGAGSQWEVVSQSSVSSVNITRTFSSVMCNLWA